MRKITYRTHSQRPPVDSKSQGLSTARGRPDGPCQGLCGQIPQQVFCFLWLYNLLISRCLLAGLVPNILQIPEHVGQPSWAWRASGKSVAHTFGVNEGNREQGEKQRKRSPHQFDLHEAGNKVCAHTHSTCSEGNSDTHPQSAPLPPGFHPLRSNSYLGSRVASCLVSQG